MHAKARHGGRKARKNGSLDRFVAGIASGRKLAAIAVALIAMSVMGAMGMRLREGRDFEWEDRQIQKGETRPAVLIINCGVNTAVPVPLKLTTTVLLVDELLWIVSCPVTAPLAVGSNCTFSVTD